MEEFFSFNTEIILNLNYGIVQFLYTLYLVSLMLTSYIHDYQNQEINIITILLPNYRFYLMASVFLF